MIATRSASTNVSYMPTSLAAKTLSDIESALAEKRTSAIREIVQIIQQLASKAFSISIEELSQLVGRDPTITERIISSANTLGYNPYGTPVSTIPEAIHTVGFEKVRNLAISLMLAENAGAGSNTYEQRRVAALSVCSGMLAQKLLPRSDDESQEELIFVCASLRNYGRLLLSTFMVERYRSALSRAMEIPEDAAFLEEFGLTPLRLAEQILNKANLPRNIMNSLKPLNSEDLRKPSLSPNDELLTLAQLSYELSRVIFDEGITPDKFKHSISNVLARFAIRRPIGIEAFNEALMQVDYTLSTLNRAVGISQTHSPATMALQARINGEFLPEPPRAIRPPKAPVVKSIADMDETEREAYSDKTFAPINKVIDLASEPGSKVDLAAIFNALAQAFTKAAKLDSCLIFIREEYDKTAFSARYGTGALFSKIKNRPIVAPFKSDIFSICLSRREDVLIENAEAEKIRSVIPEWIHTAGKTSAFIILPVNLERSTRALIVGTVNKERTIHLTPFDLKNLRSIRAKISMVYGMIESEVITLA